MELRFKLTKYGPVILSVSSHAMQIHLTNEMIPNIIMSVQNIILKTKMILYVGVQPSQSFLEISSCIVQDQQEVLRNVSLGNFSIIVFC